MFLIVGLKSKNGKLSINTNMFTFIKSVNSIVGYKVLNAHNRINTLYPTIELTKHNGFNKNRLLATIELTVAHNRINILGVHRGKTPFGKAFFCARNSLKNR